MLHWLITKIRDNWSLRSLPLTLFTIGIAIVFGKVFSVLLIGDEKYTKVAMLLSLTPIFIFIPHKEKWLMGMFMFTISLGTGQLLFDEMGDTRPPLRHFFLLRLSDILMFILLGIRIYAMYSRRNPPYSIWRGQTTVFHLLWVTWALLSMFHAQDAVTTFLGVYEIMIRSFLTFFVVFHFLQKREDLHIIMLGLMATLLFQNLLIMVQQATESIVLLLPGLDDELDIIDGLGFRPAGTMGHSSNFAKLTGEIMPVALAYVFFSPGISRLPALAAWASGAAALAFTVSRAGLGSWLITSGLFPFGLMFLRIIAIRSMIPLFAVFIFVLLMAVGLVAAMAGDKISSRVKDDHGSAQTRAPMWAVARNIIAHHPIFGIGYENYLAVHQKYDHTEQQISVVLPLPVHNLYLLLAAETGIPGLIFFLGFIVMTMWVSLRCAMAPELGVLERSIHLSMILALMTIFLQGYSGKGFIDHLVHISVVAVYAASSAKQWVLVQEIREKRAAEAIQAAEDTQRIKITHKHFL